VLKCSGHMLACVWLLQQGWARLFAALLQHDVRMLVLACRHVYVAALQRNICLYSAARFVNACHGVSLWLFVAVCSEPNTHGSRWFQTCWGLCGTLCAGLQSCISNSRMQHATFAPCSDRTWHVSVV
jgi:hypothetical protein